jgi:hypothetical protein
VSEGCLVCMDSEEWIVNKIYQSQNSRSLRWVVCMCVCVGGGGGNSWIIFTLCSIGHINRITKKMYPVD